MGYLAFNEKTRRAMGRESEKVRWAEASGIPVPPVVDASDSWIVTEKVPRDDPGGERYVREAIAAADRIRAAVSPPIHPGGDERQDPLGTLPVRAVRMLAGRLNLAEFLATRRAARSLHRDELSHGDFHPNNVLYDRAGGRVHVIDWDYLGFRPKGTDLLMMWSQLRDEADRELVLRAVLDRSDDHRRTLVLMRWIAVRGFSEILTNRPIRARSSEQVSHARRVVGESRRLAAEVE